MEGAVKRMLPLKVRCFGSWWPKVSDDWSNVTLGKFRLPDTGEPAGKVGNLMDSELEPDVPGSKMQILCGITVRFSIDGHRVAK